MTKIRSSSQRITWVEYRTVPRVDFAEDVYILPTRTDCSDTKPGIVDCRLLSYVFPLIKTKCRSEGLWKKYYSNTKCTALNLQHEAINRFKNSPVQPELYFKPLLGISNAKITPRESEFRPTGFELVNTYYTGKNCRKILNIVEYYTQNVE